MFHVKRKRQVGDIANITQDNLYYMLHLLHKNNTSIGILKRIEYTHITNRYSFGSWGQYSGGINGIMARKRKRDWDGTTKGWVNECPQDFVTWLKEGATFKRSLA